MNQELNLTLKNDISEITRMTEEIRLWGTAASVPEQIILDLEVVLDDLTTNVILHAFPEGGAHEINLKIERRGESVLGVLIDDGIPFDPLGLKNPDINKPLEQRNVGGLGVAIAKAMVGELRYERVGNKNKLLFRKVW